MGDLAGHPFRGNQWTTGQREAMDRMQSAARLEDYQRNPAATRGDRVQPRVRRYRNEDEELGARMRAGIEAEEREYQERLRTGRPAPERSPASRRYEELVAGGMKPAYARAKAIMEADPERASREVAHAEQRLREVEAKLDAETRPHIIDNWKARVREAQEELIAAKSAGATSSPRLTAAKAELAKPARGVRVVNEEMARAERTPKPGAETDRVRADNLRRLLDRAAGSEAAPFGRGPVADAISRAHRADAARKETYDRFRRGSKSTGGNIRRSGWRRSGT